jgi:DNA ligase (NAD+)
MSRLFHDFEELLKPPLLADIAERGTKDTWIKKNPINPQIIKITDEERKRRKKIAEVYKLDVARLTEKLKLYSISSDLGGVAAQNTLDYLRSQPGHLFIKHLQELGINPASDNYLPIFSESELSKLPLAGKTFVITGSFSMERDKMKAYIESKGGKVSGSVSAKTHFLLAGEGGGSKKANAEKLGVPVINESELERLLAESSE